MIPYRALTVPLVHLLVVYGVVWYLHGLTEPVLSGLGHTLGVIVLAIPAWLLVTRLLTWTGVLPTERQTPEE